jgi:hypothetical protein
MLRSNQPVDWNDDMKLPPLGPLLEQGREKDIIWPAGTGGSGLGYQDQLDRRWSAFGMASAPQ